MTARIRTVALAAVIAAVSSLALGGVAQAVDYPAPKNPLVPSSKPKGPFRTLTVCTKGCKYTTIQRAVNASRAGDTIRVRAGIYRERVVVKGAKKRFLKIIGDPRKPRRVVLSGLRSKPLTVPSNGIVVNGADGVLINGITAQDYGSNGIFAVNVNGYTITNVVAKRCGVYGIYAFNSVGGSITNATAAWNSDSGFYVGQTPPQVKPKRTLIRNVTSYGNVLGYSGTNSRYVTITKSRWFNNGLGIVPNALDSEKYAPPEDNVISDNDVYFNNWNYYAGAPFQVRGAATGVPYPIGVGILLFGGRRTIVENNRVYGNYLLGVGMLPQILLNQKDAVDLIGNQIRANRYGNSGKNPNGRDIFYDGSGIDNCVDGTGASTTLPVDRGTFASCPFTGTNTYNKAAQDEAFGWAIAMIGVDKNPALAEAAWIKGTQQPVDGLLPMEHWTTAIGAR